MPFYIVSNKCSTSSAKTACNSNTSCKDTIRFFGNLATKLLEMAESIDARIERIKEDCVPRQASGFFLAEITAPQMTLGVKYEYIEYIKRYGPPEDGVFDETLLNKLREEMGISNTI